MKTTTKLTASALADPNDMIEKVLSQNNVPAIQTLLAKQSQLNFYDWKYEWGKFQRTFYKQAKQCVAIDCISLRRLCMPVHVFMKMLFK